MNENHLTIAAINVTADGALGSRGALMLEPYTDSPSSSGLATVPLESIAETAKIAIDNGVQLCVHCIGDRANREVLNVYERTFKQHPAQKDLRWRIEHAQHINAADIPRSRLDFRFLFTTMAKIKRIEVIYGRSRHRGSPSSRAKARPHPDLGAARMPG